MGKSFSVTRVTVYSPCDILVIAHFDFEARILVLIVTVPGHCLYFTMSSKLNLSDGRSAVVSRNLNLLVGR